MGIQQTFLQQWIKWACHFKENSSDPKVLLPTVPFLAFILHVIPSPWMWTCDVTCFWPRDYRKGYGITIPVILLCVWLTIRLELDTTFPGLMKQEPMCPCWRNSLGMEFWSPRNCRWILRTERGFHWTASKKLEPQEMNVVNKLNELGS